MAKKSKKKSNRRVLLLILLLLVTGVTLSTSSYAWFTANKTVAVGSIKVNVEAQNGIQISADGTTWKSIVQTADITSVHNTTYTASINQIPETLEPVSTAGIIDASGKMEMFYGNVASKDGNYILTAEQSVETESNGTASTGKFVAFDLFFRVDATSPIYLTTNSGVITEDASDNGIKNATRVGFVVLGNTPVGSSIDTIQGLNAGTASNKYIWEPNYNVHTDAAIAHARDTYGLTVTNPSDTAVAYHGIKAAFTDANNVLVGNASATNFPDYFEAVDPSYKTIQGFSDYLPIFSLTSGITKVRIYMWIEGQDIDCENNASGGSVTYNLQISTNSSAS